MAYPRFQLSRNFKFVTRSAGDITVNTSAGTWEELAAETGGPGTGGFDLALACQVGDVIEGGFAALVQSVAVDLLLDIKTIVSSAPVNSFVTQGANDAVAPPYGPWYAPGATTVHFGAPMHYTVVSGDIASGLVTFRPYATTLAATSRTVYAGSNHLFQFFVKNLGPVDPN